MSKNRLSAEDVARLTTQASPDARAEAAEKVSGAFDAETLSDRERAIAEDILRILVKDAEDRVRAALSRTLKQTPHLPQDLAGALARDPSDAVALPILEHSPALSDEELVELLEAAAPARQTAIAGRESVSETLAQAIVDTGNEDAVVRLLENDGADLSDPTLDQVVRDYGGSERVHEPLVRRESLPVTIAEKLVALVSDALKQHLVTHHALAEETASDLILHSRERATVQLAAENSGGAILLADQLAANGRLSPSLVLRAVCLGDLAFFEAAMANLAGVPLNNARVLIHDEGRLGLRSLYDKAGLPMALFPAFESAVVQARAVEGERTDDDPEARMRRLLEHVLTEHEDVLAEYGVDTVDYLLSKFNRLASDSRAA
ncbi:MAG: DUF2336 domain-containing protein [Alphaproteobacteria bacterium]|nr:DUF2336 domain-containing protein [Alphaproteobacteria bacterium]